MNGKPKNRGSVTPVLMPVGERVYVGVDGIVVNWWKWA